MIGHTHYSSDQYIKDIRFVSNQHGYCFMNFNELTNSIEYKDKNYIENYVVDANS